MDWLKIISAIFIIGMMVMLYPKLKHAAQNSPKGTQADWMAAIKPIGMVVLFVIILIMMVK